MNIEISIGEIVDKYTILEIKKVEIEDPKKLKNIEKELQYLKNIVINELKIDNVDIIKLWDINWILWGLENEIRSYKDLNFENISLFIKCTKGIYTKNDERAAIKKEINIKYGSKFIEEKSY